MSRRLFITLACAAFVLALVGQVRACRSKLTGRRRRRNSSTQKVQPVSRGELPGVP